MGSAMTCPDCGLAISDRTDLAAGRRVHRLRVGEARVTLDRANTVVLWHCGNCDLVVGVS